MALFSFEPKSSDLLVGPTGYASTTQRIRDLVDMVAEICRRRNWPRPVVTQFGRFWEDQVALYEPVFYDRFKKRLTEIDARKAARHEAEKTFSWHLVPVIDAQGLAVEPKVDAVDFRTNLGTKVVLDDLQCFEIITQVKGRFVDANLEALHHTIGSGQAPHLHFAFKGLGRPQKVLTRADAEAAK